MPEDTDPWTDQGVDALTAEGPPEWPEQYSGTGDAAVDARLAPLAELATVPVAHHADTYAAVHAALLAELDAEPSQAPAQPTPTARTAG